jgi:hypothetical protein
MNIDLLPFTAFALESLGPSAPGRGDGHTLTLQLALAPVHSSHEPMSGSVGASQAFPCATPLRAAVLPAEGPVLTITF